MYDTNDSTNDMPRAPIKNLKQFGEEKGITIKSHKKIIEDAVATVKRRHKYSVEQIKKNFDDLLQETETTVYGIYLKAEGEYGAKLLDVFVEHLIRSGELKKLDQVGEVLGRHFVLFDRFFLSLAQARKAKAGKTFETLHNTLFKQLDYPFDEQAVINGKPDFVMPSVEHYKRNPLECVVFTAKRTLRERWRQITTEGTRGIGLYLATIDEKLSGNQLDEMRANKIFVVCPRSIKNEKYPDVSNVLSFERFFEDHLDPKMKIWKREGII